MSVRTQFIEGLTFAILSSDTVALQKFQEVLSSMDGAGWHVFKAEETTDESGSVGMTISMRD